MVVVAKPNLLLGRPRAIMPEIPLEKTQLFSFILHFLPIFPVGSPTDSVDGLFNSYVLGMFYYILFKLFIHVNFKLIN